MEPARLVVGLGNPGAEYARTRHNAGFIVVDALAQKLGVDGDWRKKWDARYTVDRARGLVLCEPLSYMNLSGRPMQAVMTFYKIRPQDALVIVDDLDLPFGRLRMRERGSSGGHNGLKSIIEAIGPDFPRLRVGIGRGAGDAISRVLDRFSPDEEQALDTVVQRCIDGVRTWLEQGPTAAMNFVNP